jgi:hypothetical protein
MGDADVPAEADEPVAVSLVVVRELPVDAEMGRNWKREDGCRRGARG